MEENYVPKKVLNYGPQVKRADQRRF